MHKREEDEGLDSRNETPAEHVRQVVWGMLYADEAGYVSRSPDVQMATENFYRGSVCSLPLNRRRAEETETPLMRVSGKPVNPGNPLLPSPPRLIIKAAGQKYPETREFRNLGGLVTKDGMLKNEISHRSRAASGCLKKCSSNHFDRQLAP